MTDQRDFFISYNSADAAFAEAINAGLRAAGYSTHFAGTDLVEGRGRIEWMQDALLATDRMLALCSPDYFKPEAEYSEAERAAVLWDDPAGKHGRFIPVEIRPCEYPPFINHRTKIKTASGKMVAEAAEAVVAWFDKAEVSERREAQRIADRTPEIFAVPRHRNRHFTGRAEALLELHKTLAGGAAAAVTQAIGGMGGIGKTTLAAEYAHRFGTAGRYAGVWWVPAETEEVLIESLAALALRLGIPEQRDSGDMARAALAHVQAGKDARGAAGALPWLMVYDNVPNLEGLYAHRADGTRAHPWLPAGSARVLITSRWDDFGTLAETTRLNAWSVETSVDYFREITGRDDDEGAETLARSLGGLPLAAEQAAAFLKRHAGISFAKYTENLERLIDRAPDPGALGPYGRTVYATLTTALPDLSPACVDLLCLLSWLSEDGTESMLVQATADNSPEVLSPALSEAFADDFLREEVIQVAADLSILERKSDPTGYEMLVLHRVTGLVLRIWQAREEVEGWDTRAVLMVNRVYPFHSAQPNHWSLAAQLLPHARVFVERGPESGEGAVARCPVLNKAALYLVARGDEAGAIRMLEPAVELARRTYGEMHTEFTAGYSNLALRYSEAGRLDEAQAAFEKVIEIKKELLDENDPSLAITYTNLAAVHWEKSEFEKAEPLLILAKDIEEVAGGKMSANYAAGLNGLGALYSSWAEKTGDAEKQRQARLMKDEALEIARLALGERHTETALYLHNIAIQRSIEGDNQSASEFECRALAIQLSLGQIRHARTQRAFRQLLQLWRMAGHEEKAARLEANDLSDVLPDIDEVERLMREWVGADPENRDFGPQEFSGHRGDLPI
ncbi:MAG: tetratricopeptide repeat protein [Pseudomonadota bacterium]